MRFYDKVQSFDSFKKKKSSRKGKKRCKCVLFDFSLQFCTNTTNFIKKYGSVEINLWQLEGTYLQAVKNKKEGIFAW